MAYGVSFGYMGPGCHDDRPSSAAFYNTVERKLTEQHRLNPAQNTLVVSWRMGLADLTGLWKELTIYIIYFKQREVQIAAVKAGGEWATAENRYSSAKMPW